MPDQSSPTKPLAIAFCITELDPGGAERNFVELVTRLDRQSFAPAVYCIAERPEQERAQLTIRLRDAGIPTYFLGYGRRTQFRKAVRDLTAAFVEQQPALVQTFLFHANVIGATAAKRYGAIPVVTGIRVADRRSRLRLRVERFMTRHAVRHVCVSNDVALFSQQIGGLSAEQLVVIPNGVDALAYDGSTNITVKSQEATSGRRYLLHVGRFDRQKRVDRIIDVFRAVQDRLPDHDLMLVGDGPLRDAVQRQVDRHGLTDRVRFLGWRDDVRDLLGNAQMLLLASDWEGMPNVVLEAMAAERPVVALDSEGVVELIGDGFGQRQIVRRENIAGELRLVEAMADKIVAIAEDPDTAALLAKENRLRAAEKFAIERTVRAYADLYSSLLAAPPGSDLVS